MAMEGPTRQLAVEFGELREEGLNGSSQPGKSLTGHPHSASVHMNPEGPDAGLGAIHTAGMLLQRAQKNKQNKALSIILP